MSNVLSPIVEPFSPEVADAFKNYPQRDGYIIGLFRVFANSLRHLRKGFVNLLDRDSPLSMREREIVILRISANNRCEYEWGVHVTAFGSHVGFTPAQIDATAVLDHTASCWNERESLLIKALDELCAGGRMTTQTLEAFRETWTLDAQLEIFALAGNYHAIAFVANSSALPLEKFAARFPVPAGQSGTSLR
jgi:alkylhydroperoxidase family enzyme